MSRTGRSAAGTLLQLQRLAGNRAVMRVMVQRDLSDLMKEGLAERRGRAMGMSPADADKEFFATERFVSSGGSRATLEASALPPATPDVTALESTLGTQSRVGPLATDAPALDQWGALRSNIMADKWASKRRERSAVELAQVGPVDVDRVKLEQKLSLNLETAVSNEEELRAEVAGRAWRNNRSAMSVRLAEVATLPLTEAQRKKLREVERHLYATIHGTLEFREESESLTNQLESVAAWFAFGPVAQRAQAFKVQTSQLTDDTLSFFGDSGEKVRQIRIAMVPIASDAALRVKALSDKDELDPAADESVRSRLRLQEQEWDAASRTVSLGRVHQAKLAIANQWIQNEQMSVNAATVTAKKEHPNKAALEAALQAQLERQRRPAPRSWLKAVGFEEMTNGDLFMHSGIETVYKCNVHSSVYRSEVAKLGESSWPLLSASRDTIVNYLLPSNGVLGFHVTLEGFSKFDTGKNGSPHYWRGDIRAQGNWKTRPKSVPEDSWAKVSSLMKDRLASEVTRVGDLVAGFQATGGVPGWPL